MIQNLNRLNFKSYGTVSPEHAPADNAPANCESREVLSLDQETTTVYQAVSEVWLSYSAGMTVLSVSTDNREFQHYYLDKSVCIHPGVYFSLSPFRQETSSSEMCAEISPQIIGPLQERNDFSPQHRIWVTDLYTFFYHEKERGFFFPGESHAMFELTYVDQGSLHSVVDGMDTLLTQGEMIIYGPNQWHMQYADMDVAPRYLTISFDLQGCALPALINRKFKVTQKSASLLQQLLIELDRMDPYSTDMIISLLNMLLLAILRYENAPESKLKASYSAHSENEIIRKAQQYIGTHIFEKLSVPLVAKMVDVSPSYLTALFHKNLQISPGEYIRRIKLQESKQMIREADLNFTEIAAALQYSTVHHFSRQFKEKFGITPTEYAKSVR